MSHYKLTYFNFRGRGEIPRLLFAKSGVEYEDNRIEQEEFKEIKESYPFGQLPVLEVDGTTIAQSYAIIRFLAKRFGMMGKTDLEEAEVDCVCLCVEDLLKPCSDIYSQTDEIKKAERTKKYQEEELPKYLGYLERMLKKNNDGNGFFVGNSMTAADLCFFHYMTFPVYHKVTIEWDKFPKLRDLKLRVESDAEIAGWLKRRPNNEI